MSAKLTILGSGSSGNCGYLETAEARILVDAGFSPRQIRLRLAGIGRTPENLSAILITHEHSDHIAGLLGIADKFQIPVYCNRETQDAIIWNFKNKWSATKDPALRGLDRGDLLKSKIDWRIFLTGDGFEVNDLLVETFSIPHDAQDPVGFLLRTNAGNFGFVTDLGKVTKLVIERARTANVLVLESNHDVEMLQNSRRSWSLKQRILGSHGHLSNEAAAEAAANIMSADLKHLYLAHLSRECNDPDKAYHVMAEQLHHIGAGHVQLRLTAQHQPCDTLEL
ncbi:MAG TPA: MBL fold metallo-hydrolase [Verrucomicrobiae bacterium]|nr:MBL fold metallo-hydrolase [Verrucomicrobiae bacterium]